MGLSGLSHREGNKVILDFHHEEDASQFMRNLNDDE